MFCSGSAPLFFLRLTSSLALGLPLRLSNLAFSMTVQGDSAGLKRAAFWPAWQVAWDTCLDPPPQLRYVSAASQHQCSELPTSPQRALSHFIIAEWPTVEYLPNGGSVHTP